MGKKSDKSKLIAKTVRSETQQIRKGKFHESKRGNSKVARRNKKKIIEKSVKESSTTGGLSGHLSPMIQRYLEDMKAKSDKNQWYLPEGRVFTESDVDDAIERMQKRRALGKQLSDLKRAYAMHMMSQPKSVPGTSDVRVAGTVGPQSQGLVGKRAGFEYNIHDLHRRKAEDFAQKISNLEKEIRRTEAPKYSKPKKVDRPKREESEEIQKKRSRRSAAEKDLLKKGKKKGVKDSRFEDILKFKGKDRPSAEEKGGPDQEAPETFRQEKRRRAVRPARKGDAPSFTRKQITQDQIDKELERRGLSWDDLDLDTQFALSSAIGKSASGGKRGGAEAILRGQDEAEKLISSDSPRVREKKQTGRGKLSEKIPMERSLPKLQAMAKKLATERGNPSEATKLLKAFLNSFITDYDKDLVSAAEGWFESSEFRPLRLTGGTEYRDRMSRIFSDQENVPENIRDAFMEEFTKNPEEVMRSRREEEMVRGVAGSAGFKGDIMGQSAKKYSGDKSSRIAATDPDQFFDQIHGKEDYPQEIEKSEFKSKIGDVADIPIEDLNLPKGPEIEDPEEDTLTRDEQLDNMINRLASVAGLDFSDDQADRLEIQSTRIGRKLEAKKEKLEKRIHNLGIQQYNAGPKRSNQIQDTIDDLESQLRDIDRALYRNSKVADILSRKVQKAGDPEDPFEYGSIGKDVTPDEAQDVLKGTITSPEYRPKLAKLMANKLVMKNPEVSDLYKRVKMLDSLRKDLSSRIEKLAQKGKTNPRLIKKLDKASEILSRDSTQLRALRREKIKAYNKVINRQLEDYIAPDGNFAHPNSTGLSGEELEIYKNLYKLNPSRLVKKHRTDVEDFLRNKVREEEEPIGGAIERGERSRYFEKERPEEREQIKRARLARGEEARKKVVPREPKGFERASFRGTSPGEPVPGYGDNLDTRIKNHMISIEKLKARGANPLLIKRRMERVKQLLKQRREERNLSKKVPSDLPGWRPKQEEEPKKRLRPIKPQQKGSELSAEDKLQILKTQRFDANDEKKKKIDKKIRELISQLKSEGRTISLSNVRSILEDEIRGGNMSIAEMLVSSENSEDIKHAKKKKKAWEKAKPEKKKNFYPNLESLIRGKN